MGEGAGAGAIVQGISDMGGNMINAAGLAINHQTADSNARFQEEAALMNVLLTLKQWERDDNAVQRRVKDLKAAGLSPVLAAGSAAQSSSPIPTKAPQNQFQFPYNIFKASNIAELINNAMLTQSQVQKMDAEKQKLDQQRVLDVLSFPSRMKNLDARTSATYQDIINKTLDNYYYQISGVNDRTAGPVGNMVSDLARILDKIKSGTVKSDKPGYKNKGASGEY